MSAPPPGVPYATTPAHVAPLVLVKTRLLRLRIFASFCANCAVFALFRLQFGFVLGLFRFFLGSFLQRSSFVFKYFLALFPLFFISCSSPLSRLVGAARFWFTPRGQGAMVLRRAVPDLTTLVGYHGCGGLSSENGRDANLGGNAGFQPAVAPSVG